ncbi:kinase-like protein [Lentinula lateritia]|uniref:Kinase-like protein n=1 Tax=Lentinula aff. lateritia TaxID=2804960 RepID=A0ACC1U0X0_9AGAR|nr:kinase-like protein [Lentinula aff. lateritia]KAJ3856695.1 kinase-like protein [Lentinula lateritia]
MSSRHQPVGIMIDPIPGAQNQHFYVDKDEEPLGLPGSEGYGWPQLEFGERIGPDLRYELKRKLGWGMSSSTWLAYDTGVNDYVAIKALSGFHTELRRRGRIWESEALQHVAGSNNHCLHLLDEFTHPGKGSSGDHSCFVTPVYGGDVKTLRAQHKNFPLPLAKRMLLHTLRGIAHAHSKGVIHTDLKHDNIFFTSLLSRQDIDANLASDPPLSSAVTQPLPVPSLDDAMKCEFLIADFGSAQLFDKPKELEVTSAPLRAPEVLLLGSWNEKVDIWTFGCLIFDFVVGRSLFRHESFKDPVKDITLDNVAYHLYQMACFLGEVDFPPEVLQYSRLASTYFNTDCTFKHALPLIFSLEGQIEKLKKLNPEDVKSTNEIVERCLGLNPADRPTAAELLNDPWFLGVE